MELDIQDSYDYPRTSQAIGIGNKLKDIEQTYGPPEQFLSGNTNFILRNSELSMTYVYPSKGVWIMFINQRPYAGNADWKVIDIVVGDEDVIQHMFVGSPAHSKKSITQAKKRHTIAIYEQKSGKRKDLEIYDDYILNLEVAYLKYIKSLGEFIITHLMIIPRVEKKAEVLFYGLS